MGGWVGWVGWVDWWVGCAVFVKFKGQLSRSISNLYPTKVPSCPMRFSTCPIRFPTCLIKFPTCSLRFATCPIKLNSSMWRTVINRSKQLIRRSDHQTVVHENVSENVIHRGRSKFDQPKNIHF